jgi:hypothetical protein
MVRDYFYFHAPLHEGRGDKGAYFAGARCAARVVLMGDSSTSSARQCGPSQQKVHPGGPLPSAGEDLAQPQDARVADLSQAAAIEGDCHTKQPARKLAQLWSQGARGRGIASDDALIRPQPANPDGWDFRERQAIPSPNQSGLSFRHTQVDNKHHKQVKERKHDVE